MLVREGKPFIIRENEVSSIIPITQKDLDNLLSRTNMDCESESKKSKLENLSTELELPKLEKEHQRQLREKNK